MISVGFEPTTFRWPLCLCIFFRLVQYHMPLHRACIITLNWTIKERPTNYLPEFRLADTFFSWIHVNAWVKQSLNEAIHSQKSEFYCLWLFVNYEIECGYGPNALTDACITLMQKVNSDCAYVSLARVKKCIFKGFSQFHGYKFHISEIYQLSICSLNVCPKSLIYMCY